MIHIKTAVHKPVSFCLLLISNSQKNFFRRWYITSVISDFWVCREKLYTQWHQWTSSPVFSAHPICKMRGKLGVCKTSQGDVSHVWPGTGGFSIPAGYFTQSEAVINGAYQRGLKSRISVPAPASMPTGRFSTEARPRQRPCGGMCLWTASDCRAVLSLRRVQAQVSNSAGKFPSESRRFATLLPRNFKCLLSYLPGSERGVNL